MFTAAPTSTAEHEDPPRDRLVVMGATFRESSTEQRERLAGELATYGSRLDERCLLHTCHRVELIGLSSGVGAPPTFRGVRAWRGADAAEHVLMVAAGFDSAVVAEEQVLGQVREAYETARSRGETGPILNELLRRAIRFGRRVRAEAQPGVDRSLADRAAAWIAERIGPAAHVTALVVGSGEMGTQLGSRFAEEGMIVTIASRSEERARGVVARLPHPARHRALLLDEALPRAGHHDVVAIAVRGATQPIESVHLTNGDGLPLVVDLSAPPAVSPAAATLLGDRLLDLDRLGHEGSSTTLTPRAQRRLLSAAAAERDRFLAWLDTRASGDAVRLLRHHAAEVRSRHLERLQRSARFDAEQLAAIEGATSAMLGELLHEPTQRLRTDPQAADVVRRVFGIDR